jgi:N-carbamoylsarcosine amidase
MNDKEFEKHLEQTLEAAFAEATRRYQARGFQRRVGFGSKPALISVDLANALTAPGKSLHLRARG